MYIYSLISYCYIQDRYRPEIFCWGQRKVSKKMMNKKKKTNKKVRKWKKFFLKGSFISPDCYTYSFHFCYQSFFPQTNCQGQLSCAIVFVDPDVMWAQSVKDASLISLSFPVSHFPQIFLFFFLNFS